MIQENEKLKNDNTIDMGLCDKSLFERSYDIYTEKVLKNELSKINNSEQQLKESDYIINYDYFKNIN